MSEMVTLSLADIKALEKLAVQEAKLDILVSDFQLGRARNEENIVKIYKLMRQFPGQMTASCDNVEREITDELEKHYVTIPRVDALEIDLNNKIDKNNSRYKWTVTIIVGAFGAIQYVAGMYYITLQISKIAGATP